MANFNIYNKQLGLQGGVTKAQSSYQTPIADAIGQSAGVASQFAEKYKQAKYDQNKNDTLLSITKQINEYNEYRRQNEVELNPGDDLVQKREEDFNLFSEGITKQLGDIKDHDLSGDMNNWWASYSENLRSGVVNKAIDDDITYLSKKRVENIQSMISTSQFDKANALIQEGVENKTLTLNMAEDWQDELNLQKTLYEIDTEGLSIDEGQQRINESKLLDTDEKNKATNIFNDRRKIHQLELDEAQKTYNDESFNTLYDAIEFGNIKTDYQLNAFYKNNQDAMLGDESIEGSSASFEAKTKKAMYNMLHNKMDKGDDRSAEPDIDPVLFDELEKILLNGNRGELLPALSKGLAENKLTANQAAEYKKRAKLGTNERVKDYQAKDFETALNKLVTDKVITTEEKGSLRRRWNEHISAYTEKERFEEEYYKDMKDFINNISLDAVSYNVNRLGAINIINDDRHVEEAERALIEGRSGRWTGLIDAQSLASYIGLEIDTNQLRDKTSRYLFDTGYDSLNDEDKAKVDLSHQVGEYGKIMLASAKELIKDDVEPWVDNQGVPFVRSGGASFRLEMNDTGTQEVWKRYGKSKGILGWWPDENVKIPELTGENPVKTFLKNIINSKPIIDLTEEEKVYRADEAKEMQQQGLLYIPPVYSNRDYPSTNSYRYGQGAR